MLVFFKEGLYYLHLAVFHAQALEEKAQHFSKKENTAIFLKAYLVNCILVLFLIALLGSVSGFLGYGFDWRRGCIELTKALFTGLVVGAAFGLRLGLVTGLFAGLLGGLWPEGWMHGSMELQ